MTSSSCSKVTFDHDYVPLPGYLRIGDSEIHGQGLFTTVGLNPGDYLGISHIPNTLDTAQIDKFLARSLFPSDLIRLPLGAFLNHCDDANAKLEKTPNGLYWLKITKRIEEDEEITVNYNNEPCGFKKE